MNNSIKSIKIAYSRRPDAKLVYPITRNDIITRNHQREKAVLQYLHKFQPTDFSKFSLLEIGCGHGNDLLNFLRIGFSPINLYGNELLLDRYLRAKSLLPSKVKLFNCDACDLDFDDNSFDFIYQSMVFSSILDNQHRRKLARFLYNILKPGGTLIWYDFFYDNPYNKNVKGMNKKIIKELFPICSLNFKKITLAPPISRFFSNSSITFHSFLHSITFLRTHYFVTITKK